MIQFLAVAVLALGATLRFSSPLKNERGHLFFCLFFALMAVLTNMRPVLTFAYESFGPGLASDVLAGGLACHLMMQTALFLLRSALARAAAPHGPHFSTNAVPFLLATALQIVTFAGIDIRPLIPVLLDELPGVENITPALLSYRLSFVAYLLWTLGYLALTCIKYTPRMGGEMKVGFTVMAIGLVIGAVMVLLYVGALLLQYAHADSVVASYMRTLYTIGRGLGIVFIGAGLLLPVLSKHRKHRKSRRAMKQLDAVWDRTVAGEGTWTMPVCDSTPSAQRVRRRLIEIHDANLASDGTSLSSEEMALLNEIEISLTSAGAPWNS